MDFASIHNIFFEKSPLSITSGTSPGLVIQNSHWKVQVQIDNCLWWAVLRSYVKSREAKCSILAQHLKSFRERQTEQCSKPLYNRDSPFLDYYNPQYMKGSIIPQLIINQGISQPLLNRDPVKKPPTLPSLKWWALEWTLPVVEGLWSTELMPSIQIISPIFIFIPRKKSCKWWCMTTWI